MTSLFCRHNRLTSKCPICSRELDAELKAKAPPRPARPRARGSSSAPASRRAPGVVTRRVARGAPAAAPRGVGRAADDGYRNRLVPGLRATADAEKLAAAIAWSAARLEP